MHLGRAIVTAVASLAARQLLPNSFCQPECPQCKASVTNPFNETLLCQENSTFLVSCGSCQTCIWTYAIENPDLPGMDVLETGIQNLLDLCLNSTAHDEVVALQSQVTRLSLLGDVLNSGHTPTTTYSETVVTRTGSSTTWTITRVVNPSWTTILSTATWASLYYSEQSAASSARAARHNQTASASTITAAPVAPSVTPLSNEEHSQPLSKSWMIGPIIGSVLGVATVFLVIYFIRRKLLHEAVFALEATKDTKDTKEEDDTIDDSDESTRGNPQLQFEGVEITELENTEVHELPAVEPVGSELSTPRDGSMDPIETWPFPVTPLRAIFAMAEIRDERAGTNDFSTHNTYYNP